MNEVLRAELLRMRDVDQALRSQIDDHADPVTGRLDDAFGERWDRMDAEHTVRLAAIVAEHGWPGISLVGDDGPLAAWLMAQHADADPPRQRQFLALMQAAVAAGDASPAEAAYLEDRCAMHAGEPQRYGTQLQRGGDGRTQPYTLADPERVDERRAAVGLGPLHEYLASFDTAADSA